MVSSSQVIFAEISQALPVWSQTWHLFFHFVLIISFILYDVFIWTSCEWFILLTSECHLEKRLAGWQICDSRHVLGGRYYKHAFTFSLFSTHGYFYFKTRLKFISDQSITGAHKGFLWAMPWFPSHQPTIRKGAGAVFFFHSFMAKSFHCMSGKSWKSRPDSSDSKMPMTPVTFSSSPGVSQHMWQICVYNWRPEPAYDFQGTWRDIFHHDTYLRCIRTCHVYSIQYIAGKQSVSLHTQ